jgi:2',3'-cyclic-nucleotide 2'-phosphodiesterase (5'-nucleotidase family)
MTGSPSRSTRSRRFDRRLLAPGIAAFVAATLVALLGLYASADEPRSAPPPTGTVKLRLLGVNDFHGHLEPPRPDVGGAAWLAAHLDRATLPGHTIRVHAGDMVGASPLVSSWFHDEPSIEATNLMRFDVGTLGNHEFDEGGDEVVRLVRGGQRSGPDAFKRDADDTLVNTSAPDYAGAAYPYVAANTVDRDGSLLLPPYRIVERAGVRVGFIGVTTQSTPHFLLPRYAERFRFTDISDAVNRWVPVLREQGVEAIVVLAHAGAPGQSDDEAGEQRGEIIDEAREMSDAVDVVVAGHSHTKLDLRLPNESGHGDKLIIQALSYGVAFDRVDLAVDRRSGDVIEKSGTVAPTPHADTPPEPEVEALVERYARRVAPLAKRIVGETATPLTRANGTLADLAADAQRAFAHTDVALVNSGSMRADVDAGPITYEELFEAQAYDHPVVGLDLTGRELIELIENGSPHVSGLSADGTALADGRSLDLDATYSVAVNALYLAGWPAALRDRPTRSAGTEVEATAWWVEHLAHRDDSHEQ